MNSLDDVIAAIATPVGEGGIAVIRVSGKKAIEVANRVFRGKHSLESVATHTAHFGQFVDANGGVVDEVIVTVFHEPHSYTAENSVEFSCHGGMFVVRRILDCIIAAGARMADPGEFTKRAFLNGRIDLSQAEAVADLIHARSEISHRTSLQQLEGRLSTHIGEIRKRLLDLCGLMELELDFAEEGLELTQSDRAKSEIESVIEYLNRLIDSYKYGRVCREGVKVVLAGKPNVGKSSILNSLLNENRAIVTEVPGTTRDVIEENVVIDDLLFRLVDTAGLQDTHDLVEKEGIRRAESQVQTSDVLLLVLDVVDGFKRADREVFNQVLGELEHPNVLIVENKIDLQSGQPGRAFPHEFASFGKVRVSAKTGEGITELRKKLVNLALTEPRSGMESSLVITNSRHKESLVRAVESLTNAMESLREGKGNEFIAVDLRAALDFLGEIIGIVTSDDILNNIFSKFCIGK